jgi:pyridoxine 5-phosphate synthase
MIELHTGCFANAPDATRAAEVDRLAAAARHGHAAGLQVNAGHGLNYRNLPGLFEVPHLAELNIGHSIVAMAMRCGLTEAVRRMKSLMAGYPAQHA